MTESPDIALAGSVPGLRPEEFGERAERLNRLAALGVNLPPTVFLSRRCVERISGGDTACLEAALLQMGEKILLAVRPSPVTTSWHGAKAVLNVGMSDRACSMLAAVIGLENAQELYAEFVHSFALEIADLPAEEFVALAASSLCAGDRLQAVLRLYEGHAGQAFPQAASAQLAKILIGMRHGAGRESESSELGIILQGMAGGFQTEGSGFGRLTAVDRMTGEAAVSGDLELFQGGDFLFYGGVTGIRDYLPQHEVTLTDLLDELRLKLADPQQIEFAFDRSNIWLLDSHPAPRSVQAAIHIAVELAENGIIDRGSAICRVAAGSLNRVLHPQISQDAPNPVIAGGIPASPGAASGMIAFSSRAAERFVGAGQNCILVRAETGPEDFRGMHTAQGVLTGRGGLTSHAAVVARGLGVPCVVGAAEIQIAQPDSEGERILIARGGLKLKEGDLITVDGTTGRVLRGRAELVEPSLDKTFEKFLSWADEIRDIGVRANADTTEEVRAALKFKADGIGLCRTEHMFFEASQLNLMRRMLFAESPHERRSVLGQLIQLQKADFSELFREMTGRPVCIRLFDPPLHEFLPRGQREMEEMAEELGRDVRHVMQRADDLKEFNPMLGMRGVRVGIVMPEIYEMQARAIFEAAVEVRRSGIEPVPEIIIPLVSANREVELVGAYVDRTANAVRRETESDFHYRLGVMVETPRAALRAGDLATNSDFLSFGTNDLTQMTYGLSRDDSQGFIDEYIRQDVYPLDPFETLDAEGVGELLQIAARRGRGTKSDLTLSICGEHGGDPESISFCRNAGFDYVSCSPYRVPIARLAAGQCAVRSGNAVEPG
ncbi:MAG: PEP-utilizing enzyme [Rhodobacteraceae bacterium]|nr:PEP-utilizing enzyme [Paracoccaceae bacterium]